MEKKLYSHLKHWIMPIISNEDEAKFRAFLDECYSEANLVNGPTRSFEIIRRTYFQLVDYSKTNDCQVLLPGRDVWYWYVAAIVFGEQDRFIFIPEMNRARASDNILYKKILNRIKKNIVVFDTGFRGSIPLAVNDKLGGGIKFFLLSGENYKHSGQETKYNGSYSAHALGSLLQRGINRDEVIEIEYLPKPFGSGNRKFTQSNDETRVNPKQFVINILQLVKYLKVNGRKFVKNIPKKGYDLKGFPIITSSTSSNMIWKFDSVASSDLSFMVNLVNFNTKEK